MRPGRFVAVTVLATAAVATGTVVARRRRPADTQLPDLTGAPSPRATPKRPLLGRSAHARVVPPSWEPVALEALATWEPAAPRQRLTRMVAYAWAAPLTLVGLLAGALTGVPPQLREGVVVFPRAGGLPGAVLRRRGFAAGALGHVVIAVDELDPTLFAHELVHVRHAERLGAATAPVYLGLLAAYGYARHPLERAARRGARRAAAMTP